MISDVDKSQIVSMWRVTVGNKLIEKHFVILLINGSHHCSCLSLVNRGIVCRHYFQIMLRSPMAKFHLRLIPSRWYYRDKDPSREPFLVASKFEDDATPAIPQFNIPFLTAVSQSTVRDSVTNHELLTDIQLYGKITGLTCKATMKAVRKKDTRIISILEDYLNEEENTDENVDDEESEGYESDKENLPFTLNNPYRKTKPKGRPKGTKRIRANYERNNNSSSSTNRQYKCGLCGDLGHNKRNCNKA